MGKEKIANPTNTTDESRKEDNMKIYYKSLFNGWVEITAERKAELQKTMENGIMTMSVEQRQKYIESRFMQA